MQRPVLQSRDLHNAVTKLLQQCDRSGRRLSFRAGPEAWNAAHPTGFWRSDGSLYKNRTAQQPTRASGWGLRGSLLALAAGGVALCYVQWPNISASASTADVTVLTNTIKKALNLPGSQKKETETKQTIPDALPTSAAGEVQTSVLSSAEPKNGSTATPQGGSAKTATVLASLDHETTAEQAESPQEESEKLSKYQRLQAALDDLSPLLQRANAALNGPSLDSSEPTKVRVSSSMRAVGGDVRAASSLVQEQVLNTQGAPEIENELSASSLLERNSAAVGGAAAVGAAARQAAADIEKFHAVLQLATETHRKELTEATQETARWEGEAHGKVQAANAALRRANKSLEAQAEIADRSKDAALQLQELNMAVNFESAANQERTKRLKLIDDVRTNVNAVHLAYSQAHDKLHEAAKHNQQVATVTQLCDALSKSGAVAQQVDGALAVAPDDVVIAAVQSVPEAATRDGVSTVHQLQQTWPVIRRTLRIDSVLSKEPRRGFISTCLAVVSSALKVSEAAAQKLGQGKESLEAQLAVADAAIATGDLPRTLEILDEVGKSLNVDPMVKKYMAALKSRALINQSTTLLRAHQAALATTAC